MASTVDFEHARKREFPVQPGKRRAPRPEIWVFLKPHPEANTHDVPNFVVPAGPGMGHVPEEGRWYALSLFLLRRLMHNEVIEAKPTEPFPFDDPEAKPTEGKKTKPAEPDKKDDKK